MNKFQMKRIASLLAVLALVGCNSEDPVVGSTGEDDMTMTDDPTDDPNDPTDDPSDPTDDPNDPTDDPNDPVDDPRDPAGDIGFARPESPTAYANAGLVIEIDPSGDAADAELVLDETEVLTAFDGSNLFTWDTTAHPEGQYDLAVRFNIGDTSRWSFESRTVVVDRTAPELMRQSPEDGSSYKTNDVPISLTFNEPLDLSTITDVGVSLTFSNGQTTPYTTELSADGTEITIDFDRQAIDAPYTATVALNGVTDLAGNAARANLSFTVEAWKPELLGERLWDVQYAALDGEEYLFAIAVGSPSDELRVYKKEATWTQVAAEPMNDIYDIDLDVENGDAYLAVLRSDVEQGTQVKKATFVEFSTRNDSLTVGGEQVVGVDSDGGAIAIDIRGAGIGSIDAIAAVSDGKVRVYETIDRGLTLQTANSFPSNDYDFVRDEGLAVTVKSDGYPEVIFMRCMTGAEPCYQTLGERVSKFRSGWSEIGFTGTPVSGTSNTCDEFVDFSAAWVNDMPWLLLSYFGPCDSTAPGVLALEGDANGWSTWSGGLFNSMPSSENKRYATDLHVGANGSAFALMASPSQIMVATVDANGATWHPEVGAGLDTASFLNRFSNVRVFEDATGNPVVVFRHQNAVNIYRRN